MPGFTMHVRAFKAVIAVAYAVVLTAGMQAWMVKGQLPTSTVCQASNLTSYPFCDTSLPFSHRASDIASRLSPTEMLSQMKMRSDPNPTWNLASYNYGGEALHGVWSSCANDTSGRQKCPTQFPAPITLGASFNRSLWRAAADVASTEARGLAQSHQPSGLEGPLGLSYYTPNINLVRDPRWGRTEEVPSEDPFMNGEYVYAFVTAFQYGNNTYTPGAKEQYIKAATVCKHFAVYNLETANSSVSRHGFNAVTSPQDLSETYLPAFRRCVEAGSAGVMCSYNAINGVPACANQDLLQGYLRQQAGFQGVVATDCGAIKDMVENHHWTPSPAVAVMAAIKAGVDSNCGDYFGQYIPQLISNGSLSAQDLLPAAERLMLSRLRLGLFDDASTVAWQSLDLADVDTEQHRQLALEAARQGTVLLKNDPSPTTGKPLLPLSASTGMGQARRQGGSSAIHSNGVRLAMIGPNANATRNLLSGYHGTPPFLTSPLSAAIELLGSSNVVYERGCNVSDGDTSRISDAVTASKSADVAVIVVGLCGNNYMSDEDPTCSKINEAEGNDRTDLLLPGAQTQLIQAVANTSTPCVLVVMSAGGLDLTSVSDKVSAIVWSGYGGQDGGQAMIDVLFGKYAPGGALPYTMFTNDWAKAATYTSMQMRPDASSGYPGRTHRFVPRNSSFVQWPFGFGLTYTSWKLSFSVQPPSSAHLMDPLTFAVQIQNTGDIDSPVVIAAYISAVTPAAVEEPPLESLFGFERVFVDAGQSTTVFFNLDIDARELVASDGSSILSPGKFDVVFRAADASPLTTPLVLTSTS